MSGEVVIVGWSRTKECCEISHAVQYRLYHNQPVVLAGKMRPHT